MTALPSLGALDRAAAARIWLAVEPTDMRRGFDRPARQAGAVSEQDPPPSSAASEQPLMALGAAFSKAGSAPA